MAISLKVYNLCDSIDSMLGIILLPYNIKMLSLVDEGLVIAKTNSLLDKILPRLALYFAFICLSSFHPFVCSLTIIPISIFIVCPLFSLCVRPSIHPFVNLTICPSFSPSTRPSIRPFCQSVCVSVCLFIRL